MPDDKHSPASRAAAAYADASGGGKRPATSPRAGAQSGVTSASGITTSPTKASLAPVGKTIKGKYRVGRLIGEGGMGGVYEGEHVEIGKRVAIKIVHGVHARNPQIAARINQEARSTGLIESENIVQVFDAGEDEALGLFLIMELLKGEDLGVLLQRRGRLSPMATATIIAQAAQGLSRAHAAGVVHRDLKPANLFICTREDGSTLVKLVDFGIAKLVRDASRTGSGLTRMGTVIGTPQYMSPEQAQGLPSVDHLTDIYSLGCVLFEALCGVSPYPEMPTYEQTILQIMTRPAPRLSQVLPETPAELDQLCADMMAHQASARPADMATVRTRLLGLFPQIDGGRMPMRSLTNEAAPPSVAADATGKARALIDEALRRPPPQSGIGTIPHPEAAPPSSVGATSQAGGPASSTEDAAGVPNGRRSARIVALVAVVAIAAGIGGAAFLKMRAHAAAPTGLAVVQPTPSASPPASPTAAAPVVDAPPVIATPSKPPPVLSVTPPPASKGAHGGKGAKPGHRPASSSPETTDRPVGGTGISSEF